MCMRACVCTCIHMCTYDMCDIAIHTFEYSYSGTINFLFTGDTQEQVTEQDEDSDDVPGRVIKYNTSLNTVL